MFGKLEIRSASLRNGDFCGSPINIIIGQKIIIMAYQKIRFDHDIGVTEIQRLGALSLKCDIADIPEILIDGIGQFPWSIEANQLARQAKR